MRTELVQAFMLKNGECFDTIVLQDVQNRLAQMDDSNAALVMGLSL